MLRAQVRRGLVAFAILLVLAVAYVFSYAPLYRLRYGSPTQHFGPPRSPEKWELAFVPVTWLIDETPLCEPLLGWAELWGVGFWMSTDKLRREGL